MVGGGDKDKGGDDKGYVGWSLDGGDEERSRGDDTLVRWGEDMKGIMEERNEAEDPIQQKIEVRAWKVGPKAGLRLN